MTARRLILLRHTEAAPAPFGDFSEEADLARPLTQRGEETAQRCHLWLQERMPVPDYVLCSPAQRTRQTLSVVVPQPHKPVIFSAQLYNASWQSLLQNIQATPDYAQTILLVGHNPGISELARILASCDSQTECDFTPGALAIFSLWKCDSSPVSLGWSDCDALSLSLDTFSRP